MKTKISQRIGAWVGVVVVAVAIIAGLVVSTTQSAYAATITNTYKKALWQGLNICYSSGAMASTVHVTNLWSPESIVDSSIGGIPLPNGANENYATVNCKQLLFGQSGKFNGVLELGNVALPGVGNLAGARRFLETLGYEATSGASGMRCLEIKAKRYFLNGSVSSFDNTYASNTFCFKVDEKDGWKITEGATGSVMPLIAVQTGQIGPRIESSPTQLKFYVARSPRGYDEESTLYPRSGIYGTHDTGAVVIGYMVNSTSYLDLVGTNGAIMNGIRGAFNYNPGTGELFNFTGENTALCTAYTAAYYSESGRNECLEYFTDFELAGTSEDPTDFNLNSVYGYHLAQEALGVSGSSRLTKEEVASLYMGYMDMYTNYTCDGSSTGFTKTVKLIKDGAVKTCYYENKATSLVNQLYVNDGVLTIYGVNANHVFGSVVSIDGNGSDTYSGVAPVLNVLLEDEDINISQLDPYEGESGEIQSGEAESSISKNCYDSGIESVAWVVCPAVSNMTNTVDSLENLLASMLSIDSQWYQNGSATEQAWSAFRDIANIFLVIIFLVIIFSQLTGYGIDNYGIKKMLPRLILMAVIINLSFLICQLAIDASNVIGGGLSGLMKGLAPVAAEGSRAATTTGTIVGWLFAAAAAGAGASGTIVSIAAVASSGVLVGIMTALALLVALVAVVTFFLMVAARMIIVVAFTAVAPIAIACYILPNTQSIAKKWFDVFKAAIIMYPICGFLYGLSFVINGLVLGNGDAEIGVSMAIIAVFAKFLPFFVLPTLLKSTLAAIGKIGGAITAASAGARKGVDKAGQALRASSAYREAATETARNRQLSAANRRIESLEAKRSKDGSLSTRDTRRLADSYSVREKIQQGFSDADTLVAANEFLGKPVDDIKASWEEAFNAGDTRRLSALTNVMNMRDPKGSAGFMGEVLDRNKLVGEDGKVNEKRRASVTQLRDLMSRNSTFASNLNNKASDAAMMISSGAMDSSGKVQNLSYFTKNNNISEKDSDWSTQSKATLKRALREGRLTGAKVEQMFASPNQTVSDNLTDEGKGNLLRAYLAMGGDAAAGARVDRMSGKQIDQFLAERDTSGETADAGGVPDASGGGRGVEDTSVPLRGEGGAAGTGAASAGTNEEFWNNSGNNTAQE